MIELSKLPLSPEGSVAFVVEAAVISAALLELADLIALKQGRQAVERSHVEDASHTIRSAITSAYAFLSKEE